MSNKNLAAVTTELIETYGNTAKNVITAYRVGNERAISYVDQSWAAAVKKAGYRGATTVNPGLAEKSMPFELNRIRIDSGDGASALAEDLSALGV